MQHSSSNRLAGYQSGTHARIDLDRYEKNIQILRDIAGADKTFMAVLKANAYGHGAIACGKAAVRAGAGYLAVARIAEGVQLRRAGIDAPILVFGGPNLTQIELAVNQRLTISVGTEAALEAVQNIAQRSSERPVVHLKIDTGLHRYGAFPDLALELASRCFADDRIVLEGLYAHFSSADEPDSPATEQQIARIDELLRRVQELDIAVKYVHLPNSAGTIMGKIGSSNLVRAGIATFGLEPSPEVVLPSGMQPVLSLRSRLTRSFLMQSGEGVSYGLTYRSQRDEWCATVPVGYADGLPRSLSNQGWFVVDGQRSPIRGRVCMDQTVVGLSIPANDGDEVSIIGDGSSGTMTLNDVAAFDNTINYEIVARLAARVPRLYFRDGQAGGWDDFILGESEGI